MSLELPPETLTVTKKTRTWRVEFFTDNGSDYRAVFHRETLSVLPDGTILSREILQPVTRSLSQVQGEVDALQMLGLVRDIGDRWAKEDATAFEPKPLPVME